MAKHDVEGQGEDPEVQKAIRIPSYCKKRKQPPSSKTILERKAFPKIQTAQPVEKIEVPFHEFQKLFTMARKVTDSTTVFSTDKKLFSLFNFTQGADADLVKKAFHGGLIDTLYPSPNLQELRYLPKALVQSIKKYRTKVLKASDQKIYVKIISSITDWQGFDCQEIQPMYLIQLGIVGKEWVFKESVSIQDEKEPSFESLIEVRAQRLKRIYEELRKITLQSKLKVNYATASCIIISKFSKTISNEDAKTLAIFESKFNEGNIHGSHETRKRFCQLVKKLAKEDHMCTFCEASGKKSRMDPSTSEKEVLAETDKSKSGTSNPEKQDALEELASTYSSDRVHSS